MLERLEVIETGLVVKEKSLKPIISSALSIGNIAVTKFQIDGLRSTKGAGGIVRERGSLVVARIMCDLNTDPFILPVYEGIRTNVARFATELDANAGDAVPIRIRNQSISDIAKFWEDLTIRLSETDEFDGLESIIFSDWKTLAE